MFKRQTSGSVVCVSCGYLVGVNDDHCYNCGRRNPGLWGYATAVRRLGNDLGFVPLVIGICGIAFLLSLFMSRGNIGGGGLFNILSPNTYALVQMGASGKVPVFAMHRWWTVLSAVWLHGSLLHIVFNMYFIRMLAPSVGELYGPGRMVIIYTVGGIVGFLASSTIGPQLTVGASGAIFGLLGALVHYGRRTGSSHVSSQAWSIAVTNVLLGFMMSSVDNYAHIGGFIGGFLISMALDPLKPERIDHMMIALGCIVLSVLSLVASVLVPIGF